MNEDLKRFLDTLKLARAQITLAENNLEACVSDDKAWDAAGEIVKKSVSVVILHCAGHNLQRTQDHLDRIIAELERASE